MEIIILVLILIGIRMFKIDLIVWKLIMRMRVLEIKLLFKIDLIVWKCG